MENHFSIKTDAGVIHVYKDGSSKLGADGDLKPGPGGKSKRSLFQARDIDMLMESKENFLQARNNYLALCNSVLEY